MASNVVYLAIPSGVSNQGAIHISTQKLGLDMNTREDFAYLSQHPDPNTINADLSGRLDHPRYYAGTSGI